jgi:hypothetical protein
MAVGLNWLFSLYLHGGPYRDCRLCAESDASALPTARCYDVVHDKHDQVEGNPFSSRLNALPCAWCGPAVSDRYCAHDKVRVLGKDACIIKGALHFY